MEMNYPNAVSNIGKLLTCWNKGCLTVIGTTRLFLRKRKRNCFCIGKTKRPMSINDLVEMNILLLLI